MGLCRIYADQLTDASKLRYFTIYLAMPYRPIFNKTTTGYIDHIMMDDC